MIDYQATDQCAPECSCAIGSDCISRACCYYGCIVPANAHSELNPGPSRSTPLELLRSLCIASATWHGGSFDPANAQVTLNFRTVEDAAVAWQALGTMQEVMP